MTTTADRIAVQQEAAEARWLAAWLAGPTRTRWETVPVQVGDVAPDLTLPDTDGRPRKLAEFWRERPALILFLRHLGCGCTAERWARLQDELPAYAAAGATVVAITQGEPERTRAVAERRGYPFPILCDPDRVAYERYGVLQGTPAQILYEFHWTPNDRENGEKLLRSRRGTDRAVMDDPWQLQADVLIAPSGRIAHIHRAQYCEDFPAKTVILGAIRSIAAIAIPA